MKKDEDDDIQRRKGAMDVAEVCDRILRDIAVDDAMMIVRRTTESEADYAQRVHETMTESRQEVIRIVNDVVANPKKYIHDLSKPMSPDEFQKLMRKILYESSKKNEGKMIAPFPYPIPTTEQVQALIDKIQGSNATSTQMALEDNDCLIKLFPLLSRNKDFIVWLKLWIKTVDEEQPGKMGPVMMFVSGIIFGLRLAYSSGLETSGGTRQSIERS